MKSPFPGMDPFIEACGYWEDFHGHLIEQIYFHLSDRVPPKYRVRTGERNYVVLVDEHQAEQSRGFKPDVQISALSDSSAEHGTTAVLTDTATLSEALSLRALVAEEYRERFVEIHAQDSELRLVTCIEVLSPSNKRMGTEGWEQYQRKRQGLLLGKANLVEIDLLRGGERMPMIDPLPAASPYYCLTARKSSAQKCQVWLAHFREPLPVIAVPLEAPDPDVLMALQPLVDAVCRRAHYADDIDYGQAIAPAVSDEDGTRLAGVLAQTFTH